jgi:hypothetical protein
MTTFFVLSLILLLAGRDVFFLMQREEKLYHGAMIVLWFVMALLVLKSNV